MVEIYDINEKKVINYFIDSTGKQISSGK